MSRRVDELRVKPLEWTQTAPWTWEAEGYKIFENRDQWFILGVSSTPYATLSEAQAAAQQDFESRIRSSLSQEEGEKPTAVAWEFLGADGSWKPCRNERDAAMWAEDGRKIRPVPGTIR